MTKKQKATVKKWIEALRSGKYSQTRCHLHNGKNGGYCCLGVLCEIQGTPKMVHREISYTFFTGEVNDDITIPEDTMLEWTGMRGDDVLGKSELFNRDFLIKANDTYKLTFEEIADLLDIYLLESN